MTKTDPLARACYLLSEAYGILSTIKSEPVAAKPVVHNNVKKLTKRDALVIRQMRRAGSTQQEIADSFDVNRATISRICRGHYWK